MLSAETLQTLDKRLEHYEKTTGRKVAVWIGTTTGDAVLETWTANAINAWKVRDKGFGDGIVLFILTQDRAIDVEVAPGLEKQLPDEFVGHLIMEKIAPNLNKGDNNAALTAGVDAILAGLDKPDLRVVPQQPAKQAKPAPEKIEKAAPETPQAPATTPAPSTPTVSPKRNVLLFIALGVLILVSTIVIGAVGWSSLGKKDS